MLTYLFSSFIISCWISFMHYKNSSRLLPIGELWSYSSGLFDWYMGNDVIILMPVKESWNIWVKLKDSQLQQNIIKHKTNAEFTKIIGHVGHFRWIGPKVWWEISRICIECMKHTRQLNVWMNHESFSAILQMCNTLSWFGQQTCCITLLLYHLETTIIRL